MEKIPFSVYDFFAYLSSGVVVLMALDYIFQLGISSLKDVGPVLGVELIVVAYVIGHAVAHFSSFLLEQIVIARILGRPAELLMGAVPRWTFLPWLFPNYFRKLPELTRNRVNTQATSRGCTAKGEALFLHAYAVVTSTNDRAQARLDEFRNQYGFARNMAFSFLLSSGAVVVVHWNGAAVQLKWAVLSASIGVTLFYRYLKFFRQYSYDLLLRYAELPTDRGHSKTAGA